MQQRTSKESNSVYQSLMDKIVVTDFRSARKSPRQNRCAPRRAETALRITSSFIIPGRRFLRNGVPRFSTQLARLKSTKTTPPRSSAKASPRFHQRRLLFRRRRQKG